MNCNSPLIDVCYNARCPPLLWLEGQDKQLSSHHNRTVKTTIFFSSKIFNSFYLLFCVCAILCSCVCSSRYSTRFSFILLPPPNWLMGLRHYQSGNHNNVGYTAGESHLFSPTMQCRNGITFFTRDIAHQLTCGILSQSVRKPQQHQIECSELPSASSHDAMQGNGITGHWLTVKDARCISSE